MYRVRLFLKVVCSPLLLKGTIRAHRRDEIPDRSAGERLHHEITGDHDPSSGSVENSRSVPWPDTFGTDVPSISMGCAPCSERGCTGRSRFWDGRYRHRPRSEPLDQRSGSVRTDALDCFKLLAAGAPYPVETPKATE